VKLTYNDSNHAYYLDGKRAKSVTAVAKMAQDSWSIDRWRERQVAIGVTVDDNIRENVACHVDNKYRLDQLVEEAKRAAKHHLKADRGTQMHRVLELILLGQEIKLLTEQQRRDAEVLKRTLDRYKLTPHLDLTEQFVAYPQFTIAGRFDAVLERPDSQLWLVDLKSGPNAVTYPHSTAVQLALYARAQHVSVNAPQCDDKQEIEQWRSMPTGIDLKWGRVLLCEPTDDVGVLHRIDIAHGWQAALWLLDLVNWRKVDGLVEPEPFDETAPQTPLAIPPTWEYESWVGNAQTLDSLYQLWAMATQTGHATENLRALCAQRKNQLLQSA
jgi:hypothetical protein